MKLKLSSLWSLGSLATRISSFNPKDNDEQLARNLDLIKEKRENAMVQLAYYQQKLKQGYDVNVRLRPLAPGDLVLRKVVGVAKNPAWGKRSEERRVGKEC